MKTVFPFEVYASYGFRCPSCEFPNFLSDIQLKNSIVTHCCASCGRQFKAQISNVDTETVSNINKVVSSPAIDQAVKFLTKQGYSLEESKNKINNVFSPNKDWKQLVQDCLSNGRFKTKQVG